MSHISSYIIYLFPISLHYFQPLFLFYLFISLLFSTLMSLFIYPFLFLLFWLFLSSFYYYKYVILSPFLYIFSHMKNVINLSLSCFIFVWIFYFYISIFDWRIYVFFRILLWVNAIWFCFFKLLSSFFSMIVKCYCIAYRDSLQEYNVILLYSMAWII